MPQAAKPTDRGRSRIQPASAGDEPARFLRNLTSLPDAEFASTYSPAIDAVFARYGDLPDPAAARRALLLALKAALKRRRAFILPRFTQAEDSWRIRECATYAVAIAVLVEHAAAILSADRTDQPADSDAWTRILADPKAGPEAGGSSSRAALFNAIVPARGRRWIAREPLVRTLVANYFTDTAPNELHDIVGPLVTGFAQEYQAPTRPSNDDPLVSPAGLPGPPSEPPPPNRPRLLARTGAWARSAFGRRRRQHVASDRSRTAEPLVIETMYPRNRPRHSHAASPKSTSGAPSRGTTRLPNTESASDTHAMPHRPPSPEAAPSPSSTASPAHVNTRSPHTSSPPQQRRSRARVLDLLDALPTAPTSTGAGAPSVPRPTLAARSRDIGDHGAAAPRIGHAADYARSLIAENALRPTLQTKSFALPGPAPDTTAKPLDVNALFPAAADPRRVPFDAIAAWIAFRNHLVEALHSGAQSANGEHSLVHLLDVGVFLVWPHVALAFGDELHLAPQAIKAAMRAAGVLAINRADRHDDRHSFPALTGDPEVTCRGLVTLPEYLWPYPSPRPVAASTFVRPPAIYGQRYRRPH